MVTPFQACRAALAVLVAGVPNLPACLHSWDPEHGNNGLPKLTADLAVKFAQGSRRTLPNADPWPHLGDHFSGAAFRMVEILRAVGTPEIEIAKAIIWVHVNLWNSDLYTGTHRRSVYSSFHEAMRAVGWHSFYHLNDHDFPAYLITLYGGGFKESVTPEERISASVTAGVCAKAHHITGLFFKFPFCHLPEDVRDGVGAHYFHQNSSANRSAIYFWDYLRRRHRNSLWHSIGAAFTLEEHEGFATAFEKDYLSIMYVYPPGLTPSEKIRLTTDPDRTAHIPPGMWHYDVVKGVFILISRSPFTTVTPWIQDSPDMVAAGTSGHTSGRTSAVGTPL